MQILLTSIKSFYLIIANLNSIFTFKSLEKVKFVQIKEKYICQSIILTYKYCGKGTKNVN